MLEHDIYVGLEGFFLMYINCTKQEHVEIQKELHLPAIKELKNHGRYRLIALLLITVTGIAFSQSSWQIKNPDRNGESLFSVIYGNSTQSSKFVAVGFSGTIMTSPEDTRTTWWTQSSSGTLYSLNSIAFGKEIFVVSGSSGSLNNSIFTSLDGLTWTAARTSIPLRKVTHCNDQFIVVGDTGLIAISSDGKNWTKGTTGTTHILCNVAYGDKRFVIAGYTRANKGAILESEIVYQFKPDAKAGFLFTTSACVYLGARNICPDVQSG